MPLLDYLQELNTRLHSTHAQPDNLDLWLRFNRTQTECLFAVTELRKVAVRGCTQLAPDWLPESSRSALRDIDDADQLTAAAWTEHDNKALSEFMRSPY